MLFRSNVKLGIFEAYTTNPKIFPPKLQEQNNKSYNYYKMSQQKKNINFRKWGIFHKLYKNETLKYYIENFLILNMPCFVRIIMKIKGR